MKSEVPLTLILFPLRAGRGERECTRDDFAERGPMSRSTPALTFPVTPAPSPKRQRTRGLAHSKTLCAFHRSSGNAPASWTAVALHRFSFCTGARLCEPQH